MIGVLNNLGINVVSSFFHNYYHNQPFSDISFDLHKMLNSSNEQTIEESSHSIDEFFGCYPPLLGQTLTDFNNGPIFKSQLINKGFEGYVFMEEFYSNTYCLLDSNKISPPKHSIIDIENCE